MCVPVEFILSNDAVAAFSEEVVLFVKFSLILSNGHIKALLLEVWFLFLPDGGFFQHLWDTVQSAWKPAVGLVSLVPPESNKINYTFLIKYLPHYYRLPCVCP